MSLTALQRKKLHASIFSYLVGFEGGAFAGTARVFKQEAALSDEDARLVAEGSLEAKWKTKRQLETDLLKVKEWARGQIPNLPPLLGDEAVDDGSQTSGGEEAGRNCATGPSPMNTVSANGLRKANRAQPHEQPHEQPPPSAPPRLRRHCVEFTCTAFPRWGNCSRDVFGCDEHKLPGMVDLRRRTCEYAGCSKGAGFGYEGQTMRFCSSHKHAGMVNLRGKRCEAPGCRRHPLYGHEGQSRRFCKIHREEGMLYKVGSNCQDAGCSRPARYGHQGEEARFCGEHKSESMVDVQHRICELPGCKVEFGEGCLSHASLRAVFHAHVCIILSSEHTQPRETSAVGRILLEVHTR